MADAQTVSTTNATFDGYQIAECVFQSMCRAQMFFAWPSSTF